MTLVVTLALERPLFYHMQPFSANVESEDSRLHSEVPPEPATDAIGAGHPDVVVAPPLPDTAEHAGRIGPKPQQPLCACQPADDAIHFPFLLMQKPVHKCAETIFSVQCAV